ncbi:hypothetical protein SFC50_25345 [Bacillus infantis]|uniref:hypothetical protein n=1 Tax=Bacillus infantis TaxID=324767 RepID=UPI003981A8F9
MANQALQEAEKYKNNREEMHLWTYCYPKGNNKFWAINYTKYKENSGFYVYSELPADSADILEAFWHLSTASSLVNTVTRGMSTHYNKSLEYFKDLEKLLIQWSNRNSAEAEQFAHYINDYLKMVEYYERGKIETKRLHANLMAIEKSVLQKGTLNDQDTKIVLQNSAAFAFLKYTEGHKQKDTLKGIEEIDAWLQENKKLTDYVSKTRKLSRYTDYFINPKSVGYLEESLKDFSFYENPSGERVYDMEWNEGKALFTERYIKESRIIFEKEIVPMLRNKI